MSQPLTEHCLPLTVLRAEKARRRPAALARAVDDRAAVCAHVDVTRVDRVNPEITGLRERPLLDPDNTEQYRIREEVTWHSAMSRHTRTKHAIR